MFAIGRAPRAVAAGAAALLAVAAAGCSSASDSVDLKPTATATATAAPAAGGTAHVALTAGEAPNWIWPFVPANHATAANTDEFQKLMYRPLYLFGDNGTSVAVNYPVSAANAPVYSDGGKTVTITMKGWKWSNGERVDAGDVIFWLNMMTAEPKQYYGYVPGLLPDNLASYSAAGPDTVVLRLKAAVSSIWFTYDELAQITPMPAAWDVSSATGKPGSGGCAADSAADNWAKCTAVFKYLTAQAKQTKSYVTSRLWSVADGPWQLSSFSTGKAGLIASFVPNKAYSGPQKPELARLNYYAYRSDASEYAALKTGHLDVGYVPTRYLTAVTGGSVLPATSPISRKYVLTPAYTYGIQSLTINFNSPTLGPAFRQLYVRQALQRLIDQPTMINDVDRGYGYPTSGPVPLRPYSQWVPAIQQANSGQGPYPVSIYNATTTLTSKGWQEVKGVMTCVTPSLCGSGVTKGTELSLTLGYPAGSAAALAQAALIRADAAQAGIKVTLKAQSTAAISGEVSGGSAGGASAAWDIADTGGRTFGGSGFEPTGEPLFQTGGTLNIGGFSDAVEDKLIDLTQTSNSLSVFQQYATYTAEQLPYLWLPSTYSVNAARGNLANATGDPLFTQMPEYWYFTK
jgi:peptide/nickel transport system substrate-binding protein